MLITTLHSANVAPPLSWAFIVTVPAFAYVTAIVLFPEIDVSGVPRVTEPPSVEDCVQMTPVPANAT